jgi:hypothetical protein
MFNHSIKISNINKLASQIDLLSDYLESIQPLFDGFKRSKMLKKVQSVYYSFNIILEYGYFLVLILIKVYFESIDKSNLIL